MLASLLSDLIQAMIDPQLRYSYKEADKEVSFSQESEHL
ncbi:ABC transporter of peptides domain protein [Chlamydia psittaci 84-8471/1]|nr:ABC transporter of peptides domain protein [Chlamydia psittaci 06-1683]EPP30983.1 ABC transporter of peptides domain protein [Chlamydia psittaci 84-8471/1]